MSVSTSNEAELQWVVPQPLLQLEPFFQPFSRKGTAPGAAGLLFTFAEWNDKLEVTFLIARPQIVPAFGAALDLEDLSNRLITVTKGPILVFIGIIGIAILVKDPTRLDNFQPFVSRSHGGWRALLVTMGFTAVAFEGYEVIAQAGDEAINPRQNIPKAMLCKWPWGSFVASMPYVNRATRFTWFAWRWSLAG